MNFYAKNSVSKAQFWSPTAIQLHNLQSIGQTHQSAFANSHLGYTANYLRRRTANHSCRTILFQVFRHVCSYNVLGKLKAHVVSQAWVHGLYGIGGTWRSCWTKKIGLGLKSKPRKLDSVQSFPESVSSEYLLGPYGQLAYLPRKDTETFLFRNKSRNFSNIFQLCYIVRAQPPPSS